MSSSSFELEGIQATSQRIRTPRSDTSLLSLNRTLMSDTPSSAFEDCNLRENRSALAKFKISESTKNGIFSKAQSVINTLKCVILDLATFYQHHSTLHSNFGALQEL